MPIIDIHSEEFQNELRYQRRLIQSELGLGPDEMSNHPYDSYDSRGGAGRGYVGQSFDPSASRSYGEPYYAPSQMMQSDEGSVFSRATRSHRSTKSSPDDIYNQAYVQSMHQAAAIASAAAANAREQRFAQTRDDYGGGGRYPVEELDAGSNANYGRRDYVDPRVSRSVYDGSVGGRGFEEDRMRKSNASWS